MHKMRYIRFVAAAAVLVAIFVGMQFHWVLGSLCALCPVGFLSVLAASGSVPWQLLPGVVAVLLLAFALGRVFCSWVCPTGALKNLFGGRSPRGVTGRGGVPPVRAIEPGGGAPGTPFSSCANRSNGSKNRLAGQGIALAVLLAVSFVVHFPVFCLICPIGLALGTLYAASRLFTLWQSGWELLAFPAMLFIEVFLFKRWCFAICPVGFFFGLVSKLRGRLGFALAPRVDKAACRASRGCVACGTACPEDIDVAHAALCDFEDCTLCLDCVESCPTKSLSVTLVKASSALEADEESSM